MKNENIKKRSYIYVKLISVKLGYSEKAKKFEKIFHLKFDVTE